MSEIKAVKGFEDLFAPKSDIFTHMEQVARSVFARYGYEELRTPILEHTELFCRGIGTETDVVQKEMYTFPDKKGRSLTMRPEATAGVMRAFMESGRQKSEGVTKLFTTGPMFRYERPQKGRLRQFHQINCECLGAVEPQADAELVIMVTRFLEELGLTDLTLQLNTLGCPTCRPAYRDMLRQWFKGLAVEKLCEDCQRRMETNPLRVLDCKVPTCKALTQDAPTILEHTCPDCAEHFATVRKLLEREDIAYTLNHRLVRGLDYYTRTTFEIVTDKIGAQGTVAGGGRYDGLIAQLGGTDVPGLGFACGMERLAMLLPELQSKRPDFYVALLTDDSVDTVFTLTQTLRDAGLCGEMSYIKRSMKSAMRQASKMQARYMLLPGSDELAEGKVTIKNMDSGEQDTVPLNQVSAFF